MSETAKSLAPDKLRRVPRLEEPESEAELLRRAHGLAGRCLAELAAEQRVPIPALMGSAKGLAGALIERALGAGHVQGGEPDFPRLDIEVKTIPLSRSGVPRESTFVCSASIRHVADLEWEQSGVRRKLARVLFVPIESEPALSLGDRRVGRALLWSPSAVELQLLRDDYEQLAGTLGRGDSELLTARSGRILQIRPKAANARVLGWGVDAHGAPLRTPPRAFYLRASFTKAIFLPRAIVTTDTSQP